MFFNFKLLTFYYSIWLGILPTMVFFTSVWKIFVTNNFFFYRTKPQATDKLKNTNPFKKLKNHIFIKWLIVTNIMLLPVVFLFKYTSFVFFWNHLSFNNFKFWVFFSLIAVGLLLSIFLRSFSLNRIPTPIDFFFAIGNLCIIIPNLYSVNTLYSFIFLMELVSTIIFYKFVVSKIWSKDFEKLTNTSSKIFSRNLPTQYLDMLFFQFWSTFFSTVLLLTTTLTVFYLFNTSDWTSMYFLISINSNRGYFNYTFFFSVLLIPIFFGVFLKLGLSPLHLYKIEVYQGIPFKTVFFYTTYFFLSFGIFFCLFLIFLFNSTNLYWKWFLYIFFVVGLIYTLSLLFDVDFLKGFFAYSTIVNVLFLLLAVVLFLNF